MFAYQDSLITLIDNFTFLDYKTMINALRIIPFISNYHHNMDSVSNEDRLEKTQTIVAIRERQFIDNASRHTDSNAKDQSTVSDTLAKFLRLTPLRIHMVRIKVSSLPRMQHNIC